MRKQIFNPYLPAGEYIPDGEPHIFGDRLYVFGSHDKFNSSRYCPGDYVAWSAPIDDISDWKKLIEICWLITLLCGGINILILMLI